MTAPPFTAEVVRALLAEHVVRGARTRRIMVPDAEQLKFLAATLNHWHARLQRDHGEDQPAAYARTIAASVDTVRDALLAKRAAEMQRAAAPGQPAEVVLAYAAALEALDGFRRAAQPVLKAPAPISWRQVAPALVGDFYVAMWRANAGRMQFGIGGPLARYIQAVLPLLTGETLKIESVERALKQVRDAGGWMTDDKGLYLGGIAHIP